MFTFLPWATIGCLEKFQMDSIILTVHNKDWMIEKVLHSIYNHTVEDYELIVVLDGCSDSSEEIVNRTLNERTKVLYADDVFETKANNIGLKQAQGEKVIIVQDDMIINHPGWNKVLARPFIFNDVFAVTAKTAHNWVTNPSSEDLISDHDQHYTWSRAVVDVDHANINNIDRETFAIRSCVNRGPLMIDHSMLESLNYLDELYSPQQMDDHDLCMRAFKQFGSVCGYYFIDFISDESWGSTRQNGDAPQWLYKADHKNKKLFYNRHFKEINNHRPIEGRKL